MLRIEQAREQPVDRFVKAFWIYKGKYPYDANILEVMTKPKQMLGKLSLQQLEEMLESARNFLQSETRREKFHP